jgi:methylthioribose-1-phosphate isomerase
MTEENKKLYNFLLFDETVKALDEVAGTLRVSRTTALELMTALGYHEIKALLKKAEELDKTKNAYVR